VELFDSILQDTIHVYKKENQALLIINAGEGWDATGRTELTIVQDETLSSFDTL
jgi:hypothetical protein